MEIKFGKEYADGSVDLTAEGMSKEDLEIFVKLGMVAALKAAVEDAKAYLNPEVKE